MLKNLLCGAAVLALSGQVALANNVIINGVPHHGGDVINVPYGAGAANCCAYEELPYSPLPVIHQPAAVPATYTTAPAVTYEAAPAMVYEAAPTVAYETAPVMTYAPAPVVSEEIVYINQAPAVAAPVMMAEKPAPRGWSSRVYVGARGGLTSMRDTDFDVAGLNVENDYRRRGYNVSGVVGWGAKISNSIGYRLEAELGYQRSRIDSHSAGGATISGRNALGDTQAVFGFANAYLDIPVVSRLNAVVGGGAGVGRVKFDDHGTRGLGTLLDDSDTTFGYHLDGGLSYDVTDQLALEAMYRYTSFVDVEVTAVDGSTSDTNVDSHNLVVGARYGF